jgi:hypothetical protein
MSGDSGKADISNGVLYEEHRGTKAELMFGQALSFCAGSEMSIVAGMQSEITLGAENKIGFGVNSTFEAVAEVKYVVGLAIEIANEGGGSYEQAFTLTAGSTSVGAFKKLRILASVSVFAQAAAVSAMLAVVKTNFVNDGKLAPSGELGAEITLGIGQNIVGALMAVGTMVMNSVARKHLRIEPLSAMTVNHMSQAFIGVRGSLERQGTGGLELTPNKFRLSAGAQNRKFDVSGHEVVGYQTDANTMIEGTDNQIKIQAKWLQLKGTEANGTVSFFDKRIHAWVGGDAGKPKASLKLGKVSLVAPSGGRAAEVDGLRFATDEGAAVSLSGTWARMSVNDGTMLEVAKGKHAKLSYANSGAQVLLTQTEASLSFGEQSVKVSSKGVDIAGVITILAPKPGIPDAKAKVTVGAEMMAAIASNLKDQTEEIALENTSQIYNLLMTKIATVRREIETKISQATIKAGG